VNLTNCRAKAVLIERLAGKRYLVLIFVGMVERVDKPSLLERYVLPLLQASNKIQQETIGN